MSIDPGASTLAAAGETADRQVVGDRYEILGLLGAGGMGNVYRAHDRELDEVVALKLLLPHVVSSPGALDRFRREVKLARRVTHPNVARVFDIGEHGGEKILTMELVEGESLAARLRRERRLPTAEAIRITRAICSAIAAAHDAGVVHRDLKPDNVLCETGGRVVVTDFGIARAAAEGARTVGMVGTPGYMAPEQIDERVGIDERADIYALGCVLFEMLAGRPAWTGESVFALAAARLLEEPPSLADERADLPDALAELVRRMMARDRDDRVASMRELDAALASITLPNTEAKVSSERPRGTLSAGPSPTGADKRVAVLPFTNRGGPEDAYVADGLTDDLIDALSVAEGLRVRSRGVVMPLKGTTKDPRELGRELDVQVFVEGSVRRTPSGFRVSARLVSVRDGFQLWARRFDVAEASLLVENDRIAAAIAEALSSHLDLPVRSTAPDAAAVELYLRARQAYWHSFSGDETVAQGLFEQLVAKTPDDPKAIAGLVSTNTHVFLWPSGNYERLAAMADRAIALGPGLPDGYAARAALDLFAGFVVSGVRHARRALQIAPTSLEALECLGRVLSEAGSDAGPRYLEAACALDPGFELPLLGLGAHYALMGPQERADELLERMESMSSGLLVRAGSRIMLWRRDRDGAKRLLEQLAQLPPQTKQRGMLEAWLRLVAYDEPVPDLVPPLPPGIAPPPFIQCFLAELQMEFAAYLGDTGRALALLEQLDRLESHHVRLIEHCPILEPLRALPESKPLRARIAERAERVVAAFQAPLLG